MQPIDDKHKSHPAIVKRLKRADGHLRSVIEMIESERSCLDIAQQLHAVEKAIAQAKKTLIHDHLDHCLADATGGLDPTKRSEIDQFRTIAKYL
ncbi:metal-sensing transcriptional repressor [Pelagibacterium sp. 26DY04]|uniref:metal-sensing transcriptional repressor n=1 Tax=Pelagibacterium sp. 26DY04 TaxID=2967130 RepID=UPI00281595D8|nr:metal-sensing transcriptional repressor [Pelagibacterium sp. 26DY04]WMT87051.1 metal-sensing transcriptional repressor [Pelagibacterium sp. 26DY04]